MRFDALPEAQRQGGLRVAHEIPGCAACASSASQPAARRMRRAISTFWSSWKPADRCSILAAIRTGIAVRPARGRGDGARAEGADARERVLREAVPVGSEKERLRDMPAIAAIECHLDGNKARFEQDEWLQTWFLRHLQIIGEAARALPAELRSTPAESRGQDHRHAQRARARLLRHRYRDCLAGGGARRAGAETGAAGCRCPGGSVAPP